MSRYLTPLLLLLMVAVAGCSGARPMEELPPQYAAAPSSDIAIRGQRQFEYTDDDALNGWLSDVRAMIEHHDWYSLAYAFDAEIYAEQFVFMKRDNAERSDAEVVAQILTETIGLGMVDNNLSGNGARDQEDPFVRLNRIRGVELAGADPTGTEYRQVDGVVTLEDGTARSLSFTVSQNADGDWRIDVSAG